MSYPDTLSRLEGQVRQLEDSRMQEARERDRLREENGRLREALTSVLSEINLSKAPKLMAKIEPALGVSLS